MILPVIAFTISLLGQSQPATKLGGLILHHFHDWDTNHDGELSRREVNEAVLNPLYEGEAGAALAALKEWLDFVKVPPVLTERWFYEYHVVKFPPIDPSLSPRERNAVIQDEARYAPGLVGRYMVAMDRIRHRPRHLYKPAGPSIDDIHQGGLGDCWLVAALGGIVARDPVAITRMIEEAPQGYVVHFGDGENVAVGPITDAEIALAGADLSRGLWVRVFERAWPLRRPITVHRRAGHEGTVSVLFQANDALDGYFFEAILCGEDINKVRPAANVAKKCEEIRTRLQEAVQNHRLVYAVSGRGPQVRGIPGAHWHAVFGYDAATDMILVWNPWGDTTPPNSAVYPRKGGYFQIPLEVFARSFWSIVIETPEPIRRAG